MDKANFSEWLQKAISLGIVEDNKASHAWMDEELKAFKAVQNRAVGTLSRRELRNLINAVIPSAEAQLERLNDIDDRTARDRARGYREIGYIKWAYSKLELLEEREQFGQGDLPFPAKAERQEPEPNNQPLPLTDKEDERKLELDQPEQEQSSAPIEAVKRQDDKITTAEQIGDLLLKLEEEIRNDWGQLKDVDVVRSRVLRAKWIQQGAKDMMAAKEVIERATRVWAKAQILLGQHLKELYQSGELASRGRPPQSSEDRLSLDKLMLKKKDAEFALALCDKAGALSSEECDGRLNELTLPELTKAGILRAFSMEVRQPKEEAANPERLVRVIAEEIFKFPNYYLDDDGVILRDAFAKHFRSQEESQLKRFGQILDKITKSS